MTNTWVTNTPIQAQYRATRATAGAMHLSSGYVSFQGVELAKTGTWSASTGEVTLTKADLASAVAAQHHLPDIPLKFGHADPRFTGDPAVGVVRNLRTIDGGNTLVGDLEDIPAWLGDKLPQAYPQRSIEATANYSSNGKQYRFVLTGLALLGESWPAVTDLPSLKELITTQ